VDRHLRRGLLACLGLALLGGSARAADRLGTDLFAAYSLARIDRVSRHGGQAGIGFALTGRLTGFVDLSAHRGEGAGLDRSDLTLMAGPGLRLGRPGGTVVFVRALAGLVRERTSIGVLDVEIAESANRLGVMGGGGVEFRIGGRWAALLAGDYLWNDDREGGQKSGFRACAGLVHRLGAVR